MSNDYVRLSSTQNYKDYEAYVSTRRGALALETLSPKRAHQCLIRACRNIMPDPTFVNHMCVFIHQLRKEESKKCTAYKK